MYMNNGYSSASTKNGVNLMSSSSTATTSGATTSSPSQTQSLIKAYFKTPEGRYKLHSEKTRPANLLPYSYAKTISQVLKNAFDFNLDSKHGPVASLLTRN